ncbi:MAG: hypothetical protein CL674_15130 [Bdellovibrionaceae bacterium]|nr:hypothetical protein [Pseudobdellovibrionaceae bacterium]|tara:strand:+ start:4632 stop:4856 length:225 start_codon:yes stop_codon:yes gene_type:complete
MFHDEPPFGYFVQNLIMFAGASISVILTLVNKHCPNIASDSSKLSVLTKMEKGIDSNYLILWIIFTAKFLYTKK